MDNKTAKDRSQLLWRILPAPAPDAGAASGGAGWADIEEVLRACAEQGHPLTRAELAEVVESREDSFAISSDGRRIRARRRGDRDTATAGVSAAEADELLLDVARASERPVPATLAATQPAASSTPRPGDLLGGRFEILEEIGRGGFGSVYRARDTELGRMVAVKLIGLATKDLATSSMMELFNREAKATARLNHPNIVTVFDWGRHDGFLYLVLELLGGEALSSRLQIGPMAPSQALTIAIQIGRALEHAHHAGILHLDLKPSNVFLAPEDEVKILDFGVAHLDLERHSIARALGRSAGSDESASPLTGGTPAYMAPEQWRGEITSPATDVWGVGMVLFEMLCGRLPFQASRGYSTALEPGPSPSVRTHAPGVPMELDRIVARALAKNPRDRFQTAGELAEALQELRASWSVEATVAAARTPPPSRRRLAIVSSLAAASLLIVIFVLLSRDRPPKPSVAPTHRQVTFDGKLLKAALAPGGDAFAYVSLRAPGKVLVQRVGGTSRAIPVFDEGRVQSLRWTSRGSSLLVRVLRRGRAFTYLVPRLGGPSRRLADGVSPVTSPDEKRVAYISNAMREFSLVDLETGRTSNIRPRGDHTWLLDLDWSPDGRRLAYIARKESRYSLWAIEVDGGTQTRILAAPPGTILSSPRWAPRGRALYVLRGRNGWDLLKVSTRDGLAGSTGPTVVLTGLQIGPLISISSDGKRLLVVRASMKDSLVSAVRKPPDLTHPTTKVLLGSTHVKHDVRLSPDGRTAAVAMGSSLTESNIFTVPLSGGAPTQLTFLSGKNSSPAWSPDGTTIAFVSMAGGVPQVWTVPAKGGQPRPLAGTKVSWSFQLSWAPGTRILYHRPGNRNFHLLDPTSGKEEPLLRDPERGWAFSPSFSPDGSRVALSRHIKGKGQALWIVRLRDRNATRLHTSLGYPLNWSADGRSLYFLERDGVKRVTVDGGQLITHVVPPPRFGAVDIHPDGKRIAIIVWGGQSDAWIVDRFDPEAR